MTEAPYIPLQTTAAMEIEENWENKKETFEGSYLFYLGMKTIR
jgi:hypothetical protein